MKVLTAAYGGLHDDFNYAVPGELVYPAPVCIRDDPEYGGDPDGPDSCGCGRAFAGIASGRATTVAVVTEMQIERHQLAQILHDMLGGHEDIETIEELCDDLVEGAKEHPVGTRLRCRPDDLYAE